MIFHDKTGSFSGCKLFVNQRELSALRRWKIESILSTVRSELIRLLSREASQVTKICYGK